jgi:hypothetical protein
MKIVKVSAIPMSAPVPEEKRHRTRSISSIAPNGRIMLPLNNVAWGHYAKLAT